MKYFMPIIFIGAAIASFFFYTNPQYQNIKVQSASYKAIVEANSKASQLRAVRERLTGDRAKIAEADVDKLTKMLPDGVENVGLVINIDDIASKYGLKIRNTKVADISARGAGTAIGPDSTKYGTISLSFSITAPYDTFLAFIQDLEASQRLVDITNLSFNSSNKLNQYDFNVTIQTYWLK